MPSATMIATMRDEGPFILEWLAYHRLIGFDRFVICSNDCSDGSNALLDALAGEGLITHIRCHPDPEEKAQLFAYGEAEKHFAGRWPDWLMVVDADEYLNIHVGSGTVTDLVEAVPDATAFLLNWRIFGSSGHECWADEPVLRRFTRAAPIDHSVNLSFKTLFSKAEAYHCPLLPHGPGYAKPERLDELRPVDGAGRPLGEAYTRSEGFLQSEPGRVTWALAQVNHYNTRSREDYAVKHWRGNGLGPERWDRDLNWNGFNRNEEEDLSIQRHVPSAERERERLLQIPKIARAYENCLELYGRHIAELACEPA